MTVCRKHKKLQSDTRLKRAHVLKNTTAANLLIFFIKMGKKDKNKKKGKGAEKTAMKTDKKLAAKQKKMLEKIGEVRHIH